MLIQSRLHSPSSWPSCRRSCPEVSRRFSPTWSACHRIEPCPSCPRSTVWWRNLQTPAWSDDARQAGDQPRPAALAGPRPTQHGVLWRWLRRGRPWVEQPAPRSGVEGSLCRGIQGSSGGGGTGRRMGCTGMKGGGCNDVLQVGRPLWNGINEGWD